MIQEGIPAQEATVARPGDVAVSSFLNVMPEYTKLNAYELIAVSILWCLDIQSLTTTDYKAFLKHLCRIAIRAKDNCYKDGEHVDYVLAICCMVEKLGFATFSKENSGESIVHYGPQSMLPIKSLYSSHKKRSPISLSKRPCYAWNAESGCSRTEDECRYSHTCAKCGSK